MSNGLDPNQDRRCVGPDLNLNCLQRVSIDEKIPLLAGKQLSNAMNSFMIIVGCE